MTNRTERRLVWLPVALAAASMLACEKSPPPPLPAEEIVARIPRAPPIADTATSDASANGRDASALDDDKREVEAFGQGGLGLSGVGEGGGRPSIGLGDIGRPRASDGEQGIGGQGRWRSDGGRGGSPQVRGSVANVSGRLPPEVIGRIVRQSFGRVRQCYLSGLALNPMLAGTVVLEFVIARDGSVSAAKDAGSSLADASVRACVVKAFKGLSFPAPESGIVTVKYPLTFTPES
jgi:hypothetical protein